MREPLRRWVGTEKYGGVPTPTGRDDPLPPHWRLDAIWATERPRSLSISADRRHVAFIHDRDTSDAWTVEIDTGSVTRLTTGRAPMPYWEDTTPVYSPGGDLIAYADEGWVWIVPSNGGPPRKLVEAGAPVWLDERRLIVNVERDECGRLTVVELDDPWPQRVVRDATRHDRGDEGGAAVSPGRRHVAFSFHARDDLNRQEIRIAELETGDTRVVTAAPGVLAHEPAWSPDGSQLAYTVQRDEWWELYVVDVATWDERTLDTGAGDLSEPRWSADGSRIAAVRSRETQHDLVAVDVATGAVTVIAVGGTWGTPLWAHDGSLVATYEDALTPPELRRVQPDGSTTVLVSVVPAAIRAAPHARPEIVSFTAPDGVEIRGLLQLPRDTGRLAPAVVYAHGGPKSSCGDDWDGIAQYFVDKGYAWLSVNFRGSIGRGKAFEHLNDRDWGVGDVSDCIAAADFLRAHDRVDSERLAIFGPSYGSYLALCAAVEDAGERFRCAVCKYGEADLLVSWTQGDLSGVLWAGQNMMGHPNENRDAYLRGSPIRRLDRLQVPLLVVTGELDARVHPKQSAQLVAELDRLGKTYEYVTYPTEAHGFLREGPFLDFHRRLERFLDWYLL